MENRLDQGGYTYNNYDGPDRRSGSDRRHGLDRRGCRDFETGQLTLPFFTIEQLPLPFFSASK
ncbi:MAG: hypothetical protein ABFD62_04250 [Syntrophaceae bacterium]